MPSKKPSCVTKSFPHKLYALLEEAEGKGFAEVIGWQPEGRSFIVHQPKVFVQTILPVKFKQTKFKSFLRQLNIYGFQRIQHGLNKGGYAHTHLIQGRPDLCSEIKRVSTPENKAAAAIAEAGPLAALRRRPEPANPATSAAAAASVFGGGGGRLDGGTSTNAGIGSTGNLSNMSGLSNLLKGSTGSLGSLGMAGPEATFNHGGAQNAAFNHSTAGIQNNNNHSSSNNNFFGMTSENSSGGLSGLSGLSSFLKGPSNNSLLGLSNLAHHIGSSGDISAFGKPFHKAKGKRGGNSSGLSLSSNLSLLSAGNMSNVSNGTNTALHMNGSELNMFKDLFQPKDLQKDVPSLHPSSMASSGGGKQNASFEVNVNAAAAKPSKSLEIPGPPGYVASSNGFLQKKPGLLEPTTDELLGLVQDNNGGVRIKNEDLNRSESVFPTKLHRMLQDAKREGFESIVSWIHGGTAFKIHNVPEFMLKIAPLYFEQSKFESFRRQLNLYGFSRVTRGPGRGTYYHEHFVQNDASLCRNITRPKSIRKRKAAPSIETTMSATIMA